MWLLIILLLIVCSVAASLTQQVSGQYGSDLHFPLSQLCQEPFLDIFAGETFIGNYVNHILQGFKGFEDRFQFDNESCTFIIKDFSEVDGHHFKFNNYGPTIQIYFEVFVSGVAASLTQQVSGQYGSDLHFPLSQLCQEPFLDIFAGETLIGNYVNHILQGFKGFEDRLQFDNESCTFIIKDFSEVDGHHFKFNNFGPTIQIYFEVFVSAVRDSADEYTSNENFSDECTSGLVALFFSMDPIICLIFIILAEKMKEKSCNAVISFMGKDKNWINFSCISNKVVSLVCKIISLILLVCCGRIHGTDCLFITATSFTVIDLLFAAVWINFTSKSNEGNLIQRNQLSCYVLEVAQSLIFLACIYSLYFSQYGANSTHLVWVLVASPLIFVILKIVIFILCRKYWPEEKIY